MHLDSAAIEWLHDPRNDMANEVGKANQGFECKAKKLDPSLQLARAHPRAIRVCEQEVDRRKDEVEHWGLVHLRSMTLE